MDDKDTRIKIYISWLLEKNKKLLLKGIISLFVLAVLYWEWEHQIHNMNVGLAVYLLHQLTPQEIGMLFLGGAMAVAMMFLYDYLLLHHFGYKISLGRILQVSWVSNSFNNFAGFGGLTGISIRSLLYQREKINQKDLLQLNIYIVSAAVTGLSLFAWGGILGVFDVRRILSQNQWLWVGMIGFSLYLPVYFLMDKVPWLGKKIYTKERPSDTSLFLRLSLLSASLVEWISAGIFFGYITIHFSDTGHLLEAFGVFTLAAIAGLISLIPGGLGSFDLVCLSGLQLNGASPQQALAVLLIYRIFYYIIPWIIGVLIVTGNTVLRKVISRENPGGRKGNTLLLWQRIWNMPSHYQTLSDFSIWGLSLLIFISGCVLLISAITPGLTQRVEFISHLTSIPMMQFSHRVSVVIGLVLLFLSKGIRDRVKRAYTWTLALLIMGALFTFMKGLDYEEALILLITALLLWLSRSGYYRESTPLSKRQLVLFFLFSGIIIGSYSLLGHHLSMVFLAKEHRIKLLFGNFDAFLENALYTIGISWAFIITWISLQPKNAFNHQANEEDLERLGEFLKTYRGNHLTHLLFLKDKNFFWAQEGNVLISYRRIRDKLIVLGDPIGDSQLFGAAVQEFQIYADKYALFPVFYQVREELLSMYHEYGYTFFKLGEEALISLPNFELTGQKKKSLRLIRNRFEQGNYQFHVLKPPFTKEYINIFKSISTQWLDGRKEKGFSLGWFAESYINQAPVAVIKDQQGQILAFATLMPCYDAHKTLSIDLMRFAKEAPNGIMDGLFLNLIEWGKSQGYEILNLGMAPLSNVGIAPFARKQEKLARWVYQFGEQLYSFKGLRHYKEKFQPVWQPRYLAYPVNISLAGLLMEIILMISKPSNSAYTKKPFN